MTYSKKFLEATIDFWLPYTKEPISLENAREIAESTVKLFKFLKELDIKYNGIEAGGGDNKG